MRTRNHIPRARGKRRGHVCTLPPAAPPPAANVYETEDAMLAHIYGGAELTLAAPVPAFGPPADGNDNGGK